MEDDETSNTEKSFRNFRSFTLILWLFTNFEFCYAITNSLLDTSIYLPFLFVVAGLFIGIRMIGSVIYMIQRTWGIFIYRGLWRSCILGGSWDRKDNDWGDAKIEMLEANEREAAAAGGAGASAYDDDGDDEDGDAEEV
jgi:hypothetical protein